MNLTLCLWLRQGRLWMVVVVVGAAGATYLLVTLSLTYRYRYLFVQGETSEKEVNA